MQTFYNYPRNPSISANFPAIKPLAQTVYSCRGNPHHPKMRAQIQNRITFPAPNNPPNPQSLAYSPRPNPKPSLAFPCAGLSFAPTLDRSLRAGAARRAGCMGARWMARLAYRVGWLARLGCAAMLGPRPMDRPPLDIVVAPQCEIGGMAQCEARQWLRLRGDVRITLIMERTSRDWPCAPQRSNQRPRPFPLGGGVSPARATHGLARYGIL